MVRFSDESVDFEGFVYIPSALETLSPWVRNEDIKGFALEGVSKKRIIEKFQQMLQSK
jgi:hypothetical protein